MHPKAKKAGIDANRPLAHIILAVRHGYFLTDAAFKRVFLTIYTASFFWIFLIPADFWDDLAVKNNPDIVKLGYQSGLLPFGWFIGGFLSLPYRDIASHIYVFLLYIAVTLLVRRFVAEFVPATEREKNAIALFTAVLPLYLSRFQLAAGYYCLNLLLFCIGSLLLARAILYSRPGFHRLAAYVFFVPAFFLQSLLVLYGFVILLMALSIAGRTNGPTPMARLKTASLAIVRQAPDALILPFAFFFLKTWLVRTTGPFVTYNAVTPRGLMEAIPFLPFTTLDSLASVSGIGASAFAIGLASILAAVGLLAIRSPAETLPAEPPQSTGIVMLVVFCGLMLAVFPYAVVYRLPSPFDFDDRNQLTMLLVAGAACTYGARWLLKDQMRWAVIFFLLLWATATNALTFIAIIKDGHTQNAVVRAFSRSEAIRANKALLVDTSQWPNLARHRTVSTAELNCLMKQAFGDESHFAAEMSNHPFAWDAQLATLERFRETGSCFRSYPGGKPVLLTISTGPGVLTLPHAAKLSALWLLDTNRYNKALDGLVSVSVGPVPSAWLASH